MKKKIENKPGPEGSGGGPELLVVLLKVEKYSVGLKTGETSIVQAVMTVSRTTLPFKK